MLRKFFITAADVFLASGKYEEPCLKKFKCILLSSSIYCIQIAAKKFMGAVRDGSFRTKHEWFLKKERPELLILYVVCIIIDLINSEKKVNMKYLILLMSLAFVCEFRRT